jgi:AcrR family transcriptional regulator
MLVSRSELVFSSFSESRSIRAKTPQPGRNAEMVYRRTHQVVKRLAARRSAILAAARDAAAEGGMAAVQIAPVASRANVAAGTVYRYFRPSRI